MRKVILVVLVLTVLNTVLAQTRTTVGSTTKKTQRVETTRTQKPTVSKRSRSPPNGSSTNKPDNRGPHKSTKLSEGTCKCDPLPEGMTGLQLEKYATGIWYDARHMHMWPVNPLIGECASVEFTSYPNKTISLITRMRNLMNQYVESPVMFMTPVKDYLEWNITKINVGPKSVDVSGQIKYKVLYTDYNKIAVVYACGKFVFGQKGEGINVVMIMLQSRSQTVDDEVVAQVETELKTRIPCFPGFMMHNGQKDCSKDESVPKKP